MKRFIRGIIELFKDWVYILEKAYDETWGGEDLGKEYVKEIELRKERNKEKFISFVAGVYTFEAARKGIMLNEEIARDFNETIGRKEGPNIGYNKNDYEMTLLSNGELYNTQRVFELDNKEVKIGETEYCVANGEYWK